jgi:hypothetical protein
VFGELEAVVIGVKPFDLHGVTYHDVTVLIPGRSVEEARLGPEGVPEGIQHAPLVARADAMHFVVRSDAEVIRTLSPKSYERVVVALPAR